jgi:uncharacterized protein YbbC (DUF1343 family)
MRIACGLDQLRQQGFKSLLGRRVGVLCHPASVDSEYVHILDRFAKAKINVQATFGPEHGIDGFAQYMEVVDEAERDPRFDCPVHSLYGREESSLEPTPAMLKGLDVVVIDLADIGSRYYTFIWTAVMMMRACATAGVQVMVLDHANPLGGEIMEGGGVDAGFFSFIGHYDVPVRHGLTVGEMLRLVSQEERIKVDLQIVKCEGWKRESLRDHELNWVYPSPNMPTIDTALVYPGMCLLEATNISEARGTTKPFEVCGAPFINAEKFAEQLAALKEPGVTFRPIRFKPTSQKHALQLNGGVQIHVTNPTVFRPFSLGIRLVGLVKRHHPEFAWRTEPYEFRTDNAFDILLGCADYRAAIANDQALLEVIAEREKRVALFAERRKEALIY